MKFCIKCASMYMVIRNEVKVMLFRLSAPKIFDQDCSLNSLTISLNSLGKWGALFKIMQDIVIIDCF